MIHDKERLNEVIEEIAEWPLEKRRGYISEIGKVFGEESAQQIKDGLMAHWEKKK